MTDIVWKIVLGQLRTLLAAVAGYLVATGFLEAQYAEAFVAIALYAVASIGSGVNKAWAAKKEQL